MSYWFAPPLPLSPSATDLFWLAEDIADPGSAWIVARLAWMQTIQPDRPCRYSLSPTELAAFLLVGERGFAPLPWMKSAKKREKAWARRRTTAPHRMRLWQERPAVWTTHSETLPNTTLAGGAIRIVALPFITQKASAVTEESRRCKTFALLMRTNGRWYPYPRALRSTRWDATVSNVASALQFKGITAQWRAIFNALPDFALDHAGKRAGMPYVAGALPTDRVYPERADSQHEHTHPYWAQAHRAFRAAAALCRVQFPEPQEHHLWATFHWTVFAATPDIHQRPVRDGIYAPFPLRVEVPYDGWVGSHTEEARHPDPDTAARLSNMTKILARTLERMAPNEPLFFDTLHIRDGAVGQEPSLNTDTFNTGQFFPWLRPEQMTPPGVGWHHETMAALAALPKDWQTVLVDEHTRLPRS